MRSTTRLVIILQATSLALAAPTAFRRDQTGPAPVLEATCSQDTQDHSTHLHGAVQLCLRMTLPDLATGPLTPSAVELIKCRDDDSAATTSSSKSASPSGNHGNSPSRINAEENSAKKGDHPAKTDSKPASNNNHPEKPSNSPHHDSQANKGSPKSDSKPGEPKHSASSPAHKSTQSDTTSSAQTGAENPTNTVSHSASARPSHSPAVHNNAAQDSDHSKGKGQSQPAPSTHAPASGQSTSSSGSPPSGPGKGPTSGSDDGDDGSGIPRINLDHLQPLVEVKANVKALDNAKDGKGVLDTAGGKNIVDHENVTDPTSRLPSPSSVDKIADVNASVVKNPGPSNAVSNDQVKDKVNNPATSTDAPQEAGHNPVTETVGQNTSDPIEATPQHPAEGVNASPVHDAARVDVHGSATKDGVVRMV